MLQPLSFARLRPRVPATEAVRRRQEGQGQCLPRHHFRGRSVATIRRDRMEQLKVHSSCDQPGLSAVWPVFGVQNRRDARSFGFSSLTSIRNAQGPHWQFGTELCREWMPKWPPPPGAMLVSAVWQAEGGRHGAGANFDVRWRE